MLNVPSSSYSLIDRSAIPPVDFVPYGPAPACCNERRLVGFRHDDVPTAPTPALCTIEQLAIEATPSFCMTPHDFRRFSRHAKFTADLFLAFRDDQLHHIKFGAVSESSRRALHSSPRERRCSVERTELSHISELVSLKGFGKKTAVQFSRRASLFLLRAAKSQKSMDGIEVQNLRWDIEPYAARDDCEKHRA